MRPQLLTQFLTLAGSLALAIAQGVVLHSGSGAGGKNRAG